MLGLEVFYQKELRLAAAQALRGGHHLLLLGYACPSTHVDNAGGTENTLGFPESDEPQRWDSMLKALLVGSSHIMFHSEGMNRSLSTSALHLLAQLFARGNILQIMQPQQSRYTEQWRFSLRGTDLSYKHIA